MTYSAYITRINNIHKHPKADRLNLGECFGNQVVIGLDTKEGELGIYFPTDGRLSMEFMEANNLIARKDPATGERTGGYFDERGKVRTQRFLKEKSDGFTARCHISITPGLIFHLSRKGCALPRSMVRRYARST